MKRTVWNNERIVGWVSKDGCENDACLAATGRPYHATPRGFAVTLPTYHYRTAREAAQAIRTAMHPDTLTSS